jgi:hypothetical protein
MEERAEREARNLLRCWGSCLSVDSGGFGVVAVAATVGPAVATLPLSDVLWWASIRSQVGWKE